MDLNSTCCKRLSTFPRIWKRYLDDTFTILGRGNVDNFFTNFAVFFMSVYDHILVEFASIFVCLFVYYSSVINRR